MAVREVPLSYVHECDGCGKKTESPSKSRPNHWADLRIGRDAYDFQGSACADASVTRLLCEDCATIVFNAVNEAFKGIRTRPSTEGSDA